MHEVVGGQDAVELGCVEQPLLQHELAHALAGRGGLAADDVALVVADHRVQVGDDADRVVHVGAAHVGVGGDAGDALGAQCGRSTAQEADRFEQALGDDGLHDVELELARLGGHRQGHVVAEDLEAHLVDHFGDDRVDLRGHDRRSRLHLGQVDLVEAGAGAGRQQAQIVAHLRQFHRRAFERGMDVDVPAGVGGRLDQVLGRPDLEPGDFAQRLHDGLLVARRGVYAGADGRGAEVHLEQHFAGLRQHRMLLRQVVSEGVECLAQRHGHRVLQLGAAHGDDVVELVALFVERVFEFVELHEQSLQRDVDGQPEARRVGVVGGLALVDVVVGVDDVVAPLGEAEVLEGEVGDDLVGVHVDAGARTALEQVGGELIEAAVIDQDLVARPNDRVGDVGGDGVDSPVGDGRRLLHHDHAADELGDVVDGGARDGEILDGAHCVHAVVGVRRYFPVAEEVGFYPVLVARRLVFSNCAHAHEHTCARAAGHEKTAGRIGKVTRVTMLHGLDRFARSSSPR